MTRHRAGWRRGTASVVAAVAATGAVLVGTWLVVTNDQGPSETGESTTTSAVDEAAAAGLPSSVSPRRRERTRQANEVAEASAMPPSAPERLVLPSLGVDVEVMDLGLTAEGSLEVPPGAFPAGWYTGSPSPGELGPAVLAGHVSWNGEPGVFEDLGRLVPDDEVAVVREDGTTARFVVTRTVDYDKAAFPTESVYGDITHPGLRLITCGGLDPDSGVFEENVVVYAELVGSR